MKTKLSKRFPIIVVLVALCALVPATAFAQWEVVDKEANKKLEKIRQSNLLGSTDKSNNPSGKEVDKPKQELKKIDDNYGVSNCDSATSGTSVADAQKKNCELIQRTRNAQYNYMVAMYDISAKRLERLRAIEAERRKIKPEEIGKLEDNTNKLLALKTLMDIDRQQTESAMFAFEKRLTLLNQVQAAGARAAMTGGKPPSADDLDGNGGAGGLGGILGFSLKDLAGYAKNLAGGTLMMEGALQTVKSRGAGDAPRLGIDKD